MKTTIMKSFVLTLAIALSGMYVQAQEKGDVSAGLRLNLGTSPAAGLSSQFGVGLDFNWSITDAIRLSPEFNFFFPKKVAEALGAELKWNTWDFSINGQYLFKLGDVVLYPQFGLTIQGASVKWDGADEWEEYGGGAAKSSETKFGINFGAGVEYRLSEAISLDFRAKYNVVSNWSRAVIGVGAAYHF
ncbi:outer membrane beta-barrel protein [Culturomica massiliensis]|uniref:outer membrane beta-barrel protein n=1 Tax=Culturomica massiliensis TaxID=1841857 RepID=UPI0008383066|nr:outer membrane beta-barrel protein [Culturomica massiliensis]